jgi:hypothetical protein
MKAWLRGVDLNHRPLGYECKSKGNFKELRGQGCTLSHCKSVDGILIVPLLLPRSTTMSFIFTTQISSALQR